MADTPASLSPPVAPRRAIWRRNIVQSSPLPPQDNLPPSDPMSESELDDLPALNNIADSEAEEDDEDYLPALLKVPDDELTDDEEDSDWEDDIAPPKEFERSSSPLSQIPSAMQTPIANTQPIINSSPLSDAPQTPIAILGRSMLSSSPMYTLRTEAKFIMERATQRRIETLQNLRQNVAAIKEAEADEKARKLEADSKAMKAHFEEVLAGLEERGYSLANLMEHVFNPTTHFESGYDWRWRGFFAHKPVVKHILGYWSSSRAHTTRTFIWDWAYQLVRKVVARESRRITSSGILSKVKKTVNEEFFLNFSLRGISATLRSLSPTAFGIFDAYSSTKRQAKTESKGFLKRHEVLSGSVALALLNGRSQNNSFAQAVCGTYLMATGAQRQHFSVLHRIGFSMGYSSTIGQGTKTNLAMSGSLDDIDGVEPGRHAKRNKKNREAKKAKKKRIRAPGTLWLLSEACRATAHILASTGLFLIMYDNINMMVRIAEQILGRKNTQENGTCATEVALHNTKLEDLLTADLDKGIANASPFTDAEAEFFRKNMIHTILRIIVRYGGEEFAHLKDDLEKAQPVSADKITVHQSSPANPTYQV
ncbi:hypothetical protein B0H16DRAFT_1448457 [Mycena metata]|uniref:Uncharacterized protein n=1 Tax=Mycena metata TaxID=1033252 RepID=A0AAD7NWM5_9AGAR|nr:hypothetical protein B0H16DRAFT_1448457 [Mycena metata]